MTMQPISVVELLVPEPSIVAPTELTRLEEPLVRGLPHTITLADDLSLTVVLPTGLARAWRDADPTSIVSTSDGQRAPFTANASAPVGDVASAPLRIVVQVAQAVVATIPVVARRRQVVPDAGDPSQAARLELEVMSWVVHAGTVRGAGDFGSRIVIAWRRADAADVEFTPPPMNESLRQRLGESAATSGS